MLILVFYAVSAGFTRDIHKEWLANLLDPFGSRPYNIMTKYMTVTEKNTQPVTLHGDLLVNRLIWLGISLLILFVIYSRFSFNTKKEKVKVKKERVSKKNTAPVFTRAGLIQFYFTASQTSPRAFLFPRALL